MEKVFGWLPFGGRCFQGNSWCPQTSLYKKIDKKLSLSQQQLPLYKKIDKKLSLSQQQQQQLLGY